jgi:hypothetical protein
VFTEHDPSNVIGELTLHTWWLSQIAATRSGDVAADAGSPAGTSIRAATSTASRATAIGCLPGRVHVLRFTRAPSGLPGALSVGRRVMNRTVLPIVRDPVGGHRVSRPSSPRWLALSTTRANKAISDGVCARFPRPAVAGSADQGTMTRWPRRSCARRRPLAALGTPENSLRCNPFSMEPPRGLNPGPAHYEPFVGILRPCLYSSLFVPTPAYSAIGTACSGEHPGHLAIRPRNLSTA